MEELKIIISIYSLIATSFISLLTIIVNIKMTKWGMSNAKKIKIYDQNKEALIKYYLPIKYILIKIDFLLKENNSEYFDMFLLYNNDIQKKNRRESIVDAYKEFMNEFNSLSFYFTNDRIDKYINEIYEHISIILMNNQNILDIMEYRERYKMPDLNIVITLIDEYSKKYEAYSKFNFVSLIKNKLLYLLSSR